MSTQKHSETHLEDGNTSTSSKDPRARAWCWTLNNYTKEDIIHIETYINTKKIEFIFQEEIGKNGTPHLQGYFYYKNAINFSTIHKEFPNMHLEKARNKEAAIKYCSKTETSVGPVHTNIKTERKLKDPLEGKTLKPWQQEIIDLIKTEPNERTINWYYDTTGNIGKTSLSKHICINNPNETLYIGGKANDIKYGIACFIENENNYLRTCILDFTRSTEQFISYEGIESIKNGIFYNNKYESKMVIFDTPHIICFANFTPDTTKLSKDRWNICNLTPEPTEEELNIVE